MGMKAEQDQRKKTVLLTHHISIQRLPHSVKIDACIEAGAFRAGIEHSPMTGKG